MSLVEFAVVALGLVLGYWAVSTFLFPTAPKRPEAETPIPPPRAASRPVWYEVLSVSPTASAADIHDAYRRLMSQYHPDKVDKLGQEFRDLATRKSQDITAAYAQAMRERGEHP